MIRDLETEKSVLAAMFQHGKDGFVDVSDIISVETFQDQIHQVIFACQSKALEKSDKLDIPLFLSAAHELGLDDVVKEQNELIAELRERKTELAHVRMLGKKIAKLALMRTAQSKLKEATRALDNLTGEETSNHILSLVEKPGFDIQTILNSSEGDGQLLGSGVEEYIDFLIKNQNIEVGISTGFKELDRAIGGGLRRGGYTLFGARPKAGKTSIALNIAMYASEKLKIPVLFLDTEMQAKQHWPRMLANLTGIPIQTIERSTFGGNKSFVNELKNTGKRVKNLQITHERVGGKDFDEILSIMRRWVVKTVGFTSSGKTNNCLIIYDYFKLMDASALKNLQEWAILGFQATKLHDFLADYDVPCLAMVQLNKEKDIAQSDRLIWLALAVVALIIKTQEEIITDGHENGNRKIITPDNYMRFAEGLDSDDYINLDFEGNLCKITELGKASEVKKQRQIGKAGFDTIEDQDID